MAILRNSAKCLKCNTQAISSHRDDFRTCQCGGIFVDGGKDYVRHGYSDPATYVDTSLYSEDLS